VLFVVANSIKKRASKKYRMQREDTGRGSGVRLPAFVGTVRGLFDNKINRIAKQNRPRPVPTAITMVVYWIFEIIDRKLFMIIILNTLIHLLKSIGWYVLLSLIVNAKMPQYFYEYHREGSTMGFIIGIYKN